MPIDQSTHEYLTDRRSEPETREVLSDLELTLGWRPTRLGVALWIISDANADAAAAANAMSQLLLQGRAV